MIAVQKFGGETLKNIERIKKIARFVKKEVQEGLKPVLVVSAMGDETDQLLEMARQICSNPPQRELDALLATGEERAAALVSMALWAEGLESVSLNSLQIGLEADAKGRVKGIKQIDKVKKFLEQGKIPVITGFQGMIEGTDEVVTLGRGGSDLTAIAVAGALGGKEVHLFKDVDGIFTVDPRVVPTAKKIRRISYLQMVQLSAAGAGVVQDRAVKLAQDLGVNIRVMISPSISQSDGGTLICAGGTLESMESNAWQPALAIEKNLYIINFDKVQNIPGEAEKIFNCFFKTNTNVIECAQTISEKETKISILVKEKDRVEEELKRSEKNFSIIPKMAALTLVDPAMKETPGYLWRIAKALKEVNVNIEMISTAMISISVVIKEEDLKKAAESIAVEFDLLEKSQ